MVVAQAPDGAARQGGDGQRRVDAQAHGDDRAVQHHQPRKGVRALVAAEHPAQVIDHAVAHRVAHPAAAQGVNRDEGAARRAQHVLDRPRQWPPQRVRAQDGGRPARRPGAVAGQAGDPREQGIDARIGPRAGPTHGEGADLGLHPVARQIEAARRIVAADHRQNQGMVDG